MTLQSKAQIETTTTERVVVTIPPRIRGELIALKESLEAQLYGNISTGEDYARAAPEADGTPGMTDMADTAVDVHDRVVALAVNGNIARRLKQLNETLARIDDGMYGICAHCLQPIAADRLAARPFATLCITCQSQADRGRLKRS